MQPSVLEAGSRAIVVVQRFWEVQPVGTDLIFLIIAVCLTLAIIFGVLLFPVSWVRPHQ
jgi:hypothetical protein